MNIQSRTIENPAIGDRATFLETVEESNGRHTHVEVCLAPGGGNGLHAHRTYDETFEVLEGMLGVQVGKEKLLLKAGQTITAPANVMHCFFNPSDAAPVLFRVCVEPGHAGFERALHIAYGLARDGAVFKDGTPKSFYHLALLADMSDIRLPGLVGVLGPVLNWAARRARAKGIEQDLIKRYCGEPAPVLADAV